MFHRDQSIFYSGICEDRNDPQQIGRVRVRVHGLHTFDKVALPTEDLPWAMVLQSTMSAATSGIGYSPTGIVEGATVVVFFIDGENYQIPIVLGTLAGIPTARANTQLGFSDPNGVYPLESYLNQPDVPRVARNSPNQPPEEVVEDIESRQKDLFTGLKEFWSEPESQYSAEYPKNQVFRTESGHLREFDDTPGKERINIRHRMGTKMEMLPDGSISHRVKKDKYEVIFENDYLYVKGNASITVDGNIQVLCKSSAEIVVEGNANLKVKGNLQESVDGSCVRTVKGKMWIHSDDELIFDAKKIYWNTEGKTAPNDLAPALEVTALDDALQDKDEPETSEDIPADTLNKLEERSGATLPVPGEADNTPPEPFNEEDIIVAKCEDIPKDWNYTTRLTSRYSIGSFSRNAVFPHQIRAQHGLTELEIICNLKHLAENIVEPLANKYGSDKIQINSGFRQGNGRSQHERGLASDIVLRGFDADDYVEAMKWIRDNLPYDQLILEKARSWWIHVSYRSDGKNRRQILTRVGPNKYQPGIIRLA